MQARAVALKTRPGMPTTDNFQIIDIGANPGR